VATVRTGDRFPFLSGEIDPVDGPPDSLKVWFYWKYTTEKLWIWNSEVADHRWIPVPTTATFPDVDDHPDPPLTGAIGYRFSDTGEVWLMGPSGVSGGILLGIVK